MIFSVVKGYKLNLHVHPTPLQSAILLTIALWLCTHAFPNSLLTSKGKLIFIDEVKKTYANCHFLSSLSLSHLLMYGRRRALFTNELEDFKVLPPKKLFNIIWSCVILIKMGLNVYSVCCVYFEYLTFLVDIRFS